MLAVAIFDFILNKIPVNANNKPCSGNMPEQPELAEIANITGVPVLHKSPSNQLIKDVMFLFEKVESIDL